MYNLMYLEGRCQIYNQERRALGLIASAVSCTKVKQIKMSKEESVLVSVFPFMETFQVSFSIPEGWPSRTCFLTGCVPSGNSMF